MIARIWTATTTPAQAPAYAEHFRTRVLPVLRTTDGNGGAMLLQRAASDAVEIQVITFWHCVDSIRNFTGADTEAAVVAEEAAALLTQFDRRVRHYEVAAMEDLSP